MGQFAIYLRRSTQGDEDKNYSIEAQQLDIETRWAEYAQHELVARYSDPGGKSYTLARPVFQSMMADAKARKFDTLVVGRWDRFSRIQEQQAVAIHQLRQYGVKVISATEPIPDGPVGTLIRNNYAFAAELELYNLRDRTYGGKKRRVKNGKLPGQPGPLYGYLYADKGSTRYVEDPETAPVVRRIFALFISGLKLTEISQRLHDEGVLTPSALWLQRGLSTGRGVSEKWSYVTLYKMITNRAYIGQYVGFRRKTEDVEVVHPITREIQVVQRQIEREEDDPDRVVFDESVCPPLIQEDVFLAAQDLLHRNKVESPRRLPSPETGLLRNGFARCGYCGGYLVLNYVKSLGYYRYVCAKRSRECEGNRFSWKTDELDDITWNFLVSRFEQPESIRAKLAVWKADYDEGKSIEADHLAAIEAQIEAADKRRKNSTTLAISEDDPDQRAAYRLSATNEAKLIKGLTKERDALRLVVGKRDLQDKIVDELTASGQRAAAQLRLFDYDSKRRAMFALNVRMDVRKKGTPDDLTFYWAFSEVLANTMEYLGMPVSSFDFLSTRTC